MRHRLLILLFALFTVGVCYAERVVIPTPQHYEQHEGSITIMQSSVVCYADYSLAPLAKYLADKLGIDHKRGDDGTIVLAMDDTLAAEGYHLTVDTKRIIIVGGEYGGAFNGVVTLLQLLPENIYCESAESCTVECCKIEDAPRYAHRGFMLDVSRTWIDKEAVKAYIDILAYHKINSLRLHLTDDEAWRIEIKSHPELAEIGGFRGGDSPVWPRYGRWNEKWGGYYTQEDMREIIAYAAVRNIDVIPEIDLPGHSLCMASLHPEILCSYEPRLAVSLGHDTRSAFCPSKEANYELLQDIIDEICELFTTQYIHIGGDEVEMSQWRSCPDCRAFMQANGLSDTKQLQAYFTRRVAAMVEAHGKRAAVWNEAIDGGRLTEGTRVYGWEGVRECRRSAREGYETVVMPGQYFYFDMKQSSREPGHDWAAIFDARKVYEFTLSANGFTPEEQGSVVGFESSFFSEIYLSQNPEKADYLHYQTFPRMVAFAETSWVASDTRDWSSFYDDMVEHYARLDAMGVAYRLAPPMIKYEGGMLTATTDDGSAIYYTREPMDVEMLYREPIATDKPAEYSFVSRRGNAHSTASGVSAHFRTITPAFTISSSMSSSEKFSFEKAEEYGRLARTSRAADVGDWVQFTFDAPVHCRMMKVATGNFQLPRYLFENGYVEVKFEGGDFERVGELENGAFFIKYPSRAICAVRIVCSSRGNGEKWVSIQPPTIYPIL